MILMLCCYSILLRCHCHMNDVCLHGNDMQSGQAQPIITDGFHGGDIGPASQQLFADALAGETLLSSMTKVMEYSALASSPIGY